MTKLALVIIHYGSPAVTRACLIALRPKLAGNELILINNTPEDITDLVALIPQTRLIDNRANLGFAKAVNQGITLALTDPAVTHFMLVNNDLSLAFGTLAELTRTFDRYPRVGIVSPVLHHGNKYDWGGKYNRWLALVKHVNWENKPKTTLSVTHVAGAAMLLSRALIDRIGLFDERFFLYYEDLDYCLRATSAGFTVHINPQVVAEHAVSSSSRLLTRTLHQWRSHVLFVTKHLPLRALPTAIITDLVYYPLLTLKSLFAK